MGNIEQSIAKQAVLAGAKIPDRIQNAPAINKGNELFFSAFFELDSDRQFGMSIGPIPWRSINEYAKEYHFDEWQRELLFYSIQKLDKVYLEKVNSDNANTIRK
jgi:hypothetical protein